MSSSDLPALNAALNASAFALLVLGLVSIKAGRRRAHAVAMIAASIVSTGFLASYLYYHFAVQPELGHTPFRREGAIKTAYYAMLISHIVLAALNLPMVVVTLVLAWRRSWVRHRRLARWTLPIWLYVSLTGVLVYLALYRWNPPAAA